MMKMTSAHLTAASNSAFSSSDGFAEPHVSMNREVTSSFRTKLIGGRTRAREGSSATGSCNFCFLFFVFFCFFCFLFCFLFFFFFFF